MFEPWRFQRILLHFRHLDDPLLSFISTIVGRGVSDVGSIIVAFRDVLRLGSLDLAVGDLLQCKPSSFCCRHD